MQGKNTFSTFTIKKTEINLDLRLNAFSSLF